MMSINLPKGMIEVGGVQIETATPTPKIIENIKANKNRDVVRIDNSIDWRGSVPIAVVGGGPSLKYVLDELREFKYILAAGSVHDYLIENNILPRWCAVCDSDPLVNKYLQRKDWKVKYLISSQCSPETFEYLKDNQVIMWHSGSDDINFNEENYGPGALPIGGGCTIGTRSMVLAMGMGFYNLHLFGLDTCVSSDNERYSYPLQDPIYEGKLANDYYDMVFEEGGPKFRMLGYHIAQLFDFKGLMAQYAGRMGITVHGNSLLSYFMELAQRRLQEITPEERKILTEREKQYGYGNRPHGPRIEPICSG